MSITIEISPGELIDKLTILDIKCARIKSEEKLKNVRYERELLTRSRDAAVAPSPKLDELTSGLREVNEALWEIEDEIRLCEQRSDFGERFVELARSVYITNDRRADLKRQINELLDSPLFEEKDYTEAS